MEATFITPLLLLLISLGIGGLWRNASRQSDKIDMLTEKVSEQNTTLATIATTLASVVVRVDALDRWKDMMQQRENDSLRAEVEELKAGRGRRGGDT